MSSEFDEVLMLPVLSEWKEEKGIATSRDEGPAV
jgi:hypothetical protein